MWGLPGQEFIMGLGIIVQFLINLVFNWKWRSEGRGRTGDVWQLASSVSRFWFLWFYGYFSG